jgi:hypothetical protein
MWCSLSAARGGRITWEVDMKDGGWARKELGGDAPDNDGGSSMC